MNRTPRVRKVPRKDFSSPVQLIALVRRHPVLWEPVHPLYCDNGVREEAWISISKLLLKSYFNVTAAECKAEWQQIRITRSNHKRRRERRIRSGMPAKRILKPYLYEEETSFLEGVKVQEIQEENLEIDSPKIEKDSEAEMSCSDGGNGEEEDEDVSGEQASDSDKENAPPSNEMEFSMLREDSDVQFGSPFRSTPVVEKNHPNSGPHQEPLAKKKVGHVDAWDFKKVKNPSQLAKTEQSEEYRIDEDGLLNARVLKKMSLQDAKRKKQEERRERIAAKVKASGIKNLQMSKGVGGDARSALESIVAQNLMAEEEEPSQWKYFGLSLAVRLDLLPTCDARSVTLQIYQLIHDAECKAELAATVRTPVTCKAQAGTEINVIEMTREMQDEVDHAFSAAQDSILVEENKFRIHGRDISTLQPKVWLVDTIIYFYLRLIAREVKAHYKVLAYECYEVQYLMMNGQMPETSRKRLSQQEDIFKHELMLFPVWVGSNHWCLAVANTVKKEINYYDNLKGQNDACLNALKAFLIQLEEGKVENELHPQTEWIAKHAKDIPRQLNGSDCGVFLCMFAKYLSLGWKLTFTQKDMPEFRRIITYEILKKQLLEGKCSSPL